MADKNLAKVMKKDEKRKQDSKEEKGKDKKRKMMPKGNMFRPQPQQPMGYGWPGQQAMMPYQAPYPTGYQSYPPPMAMGAYGYTPRPEARACLNCKQIGHIARFCPHRPAPSAALGAAPK